MQSVISFGGKGGRVSAKGAVAPPPLATPLHAFVCKLNWRALTLSDMKCSVTFGPFTKTWDEFSLESLPHRSCHLQSLMPPCFFYFTCAVVGNNESCGHSRKTKRIVFISLLKMCIFITTGKNEKVITKPFSMSLP